MKHHFSKIYLHTTLKIHIHIDLMSTLNIRLFTNMQLVPELKSSRLKFEKSTKKNIFHVQITSRFQRVKVSSYTSIHLLKTSFPLAIYMTNFGN